MKSGYFLGIFEGHADPAVAIVRGGEIVAYAEEERFIRQKHAWGVYPHKSLDFCLNTAGISLSDVDAVGINWDLDGYTNGRIGSFFDEVNSSFDVDHGTRAWQRSVLGRFGRAATEGRHHFEWRRACGDIEFPPIVSAPHHYTHAFQATMQSGFDESLCLTIDGSGDEHCTVLWEHRGESLAPIYERKMPHSLGWFYAAFTEYLGFKAYDGEYKLMGLAAYGRPNNELSAKVSHILNVEPDLPEIYTVEPTFIHYGEHTYSTRFTDRLVELFGQTPRLSTEEYSEWWEDLAFAVQAKLEDAACALIEYGIKKTGHRKITIGGGVGLNVKMNSRLFELAGVHDVWANPLCSDGGAAVGAALVAEYNAIRIYPKKLTRLNYGYSEPDVESVLRSAKVVFTKPTDIATAVAKLIADGKIVGWFQGAMEAGPRALGQRCILADPRAIASRDKVNSIVKFREYWRPFCPSILAERADDYLVRYTNAPFMIIAFPATEKLKADAPAVVHVDGTARVQIVEKDVLPLYHRLISEFESLTGVGVLLNTSFNVKGEPMVCTARDALRTFWSTGLDALAIGDCLVQKPEASA
jgi:carbamoyltransferase